MLSYLLSVLEYEIHQHGWQADFPHLPKVDFALNTQKYKDDDRKQLTNRRCQVFKCNVSRKPLQCIDVIILDEGHVVEVTF